MIRIVVKYPLALRPGHGVEVVEVVAVWCADRMVALRHQHHGFVGHAHGFIQRTVIGVDALECKTLRRVQTVIVGVRGELVFPLLQAYGIVPTKLGPTIVDISDNNY